MSTGFLSGVLEAFWNQTAVLATRLCKYTKATELYTLNGQIA